MSTDDVYMDVLDQINEAENGTLSNNKFNRLLYLAQLSCIDWISGDISDITPPQPYLTQKNRDYLSPFIQKLPAQVEKGIITKPGDYYTYENSFLLGDYNQVSDCETDLPATNCNVIIELLSSDEFYDRCNTAVEGLQPSFLKPICKEVGKTFEYLPADLGSITLEYIKYPSEAKRAVKIDEVMNDEVYDEANSVDLEWPEYARPILVWFICDRYFNSIRESAGKQFNQATGKTVRDAK